MYDPPKLAESLSIPLRHFDVRSMRVCPAGEWDLATAPLVHQVLDACWIRYQRVVLDLIDVSFLSGRGLRRLEHTGAQAARRAARQAARRDAQLLVAAPRDHPAVRAAVGGGGASGPVLVASRGRPGR